MSVWNLMVINAVIEIFQSGPNWTNIASYVASCIQMTKSIMSQIIWTITALTFTDIISLSLPQIPRYCLKEQISFAWCSNFHGFYCILCSQTSEKLFCCCCCFCCKLSVYIKVLSCWAQNIFPINRLTAQSILIIWLLPRRLHYSFFNHISTHFIIKHKSR